MKRPDKYPALDPREPGIYRRILDAAQEMRSARQAETEIARLMQRARRCAAIRAGVADSVSPP